MADIGQVRIVRQRHIMVLLVVHQRLASPEFNIAGGGDRAESAPQVVRGDLDTGFCSNDLKLGSTVLEMRYLAAFRTWWKDVAVSLGPGADDPQCHGR